MIADRFRSDITSKISVPADGVCAAGTAAGKAIAAVVQALGRGDSLLVNADGVTCSASHKMQHLMVQSAGSTGAPKTIRRSPASWIASFEVTRDVFKVDQSAPYAVLGAMSHSLTLYAVLEALHLGSDLSILTGLSPRSQIEALQQNEPQVLYATPTQLRLLLGRAPVRSVEYLFCGGGKLDSKTRTALSDVFPNATIREFFGASETSFVTMSDARTPDGSVGCAYPHVDLIVRGSDGNATSGIGEIWVKSPYLFDGYVEADRADSIWHNGYLSIGEMGKIDNAGNLFVMGRKNRMVTVADNNVFPEAIEAIMQSVPNVEKCAAIPVNDPIRGQVIVGIVESVSHDDIADQVMKACKNALGAIATPRRVEIIEDMPLLDAGKPDLQALAKWLEART